MTLTNFPNGIKTSEVVTGGSGGATVITPSETGATSSDALSVASGTAVNGQSGGVFLFSGDTSGTGQTGNTWVYTGNTSAGTASTGNVNILSGDSFGGNSGNIGLTTGAAAGTRGQISLDAPTTLIHSTLISFDNGSTAPGSDVSLLGVDVTTGTSSELDLVTGNATGAGVKTGPLFLGTGNSAADTSGLASLGSGTAGTTSGECDIFSGDGAATGDVVVSSGNASAGNSGSIKLVLGTATGTRGNVVFTGLPTADPHVVGAAWIDVAASRVLKVSNG